LLKRVLAVHDISCVGKCSLTVALPILSAMGVETSVLPTAVLSTHTGGFTGFTYRDLTDDIRPIADHWASLGLQFDGIYTGFLGSFEQLDLVAELFARFKRGDTVVVVDPVMADNGELYGIFPDTFPAGMRALCEKADVILPNLTEASLMLDMPYQEPPYTQAYIEDMLKQLAAIHGGGVVLTGVAFNETELGAAVYDRGAVSYAMAARIPGYYHGTGDVFGSALTGALLRGAPQRGRTLPEAARIAVDFTVDSIRRTRDDGTEIRYGVNFEESLKGLINRL